MIIIKGKSASSGVAVAPIAAKPDASDEDRVTLLTSLNPEGGTAPLPCGPGKSDCPIGRTCRESSTGNR